MKIIKLFLDDIRDAPDKSWYVVRDYQRCIDLLKSGKVAILSLDHDLGTNKTGYDVVKWIEEKVYTENFDPPEIIVHSANPVGRLNIEAAIWSIYRKIDE